MKTDRIALWLLLAAVVILTLVLHHNRDTTYPVPPVQQCVQVPDRDMFNPAVHLDIERMVSR